MQVKLIILVIIFSIAFSLIYDNSIYAEEDRNGLTPGDGIKFLYSDHIDVVSLQMGFHTDKDPQLISVTVGSHFLNETKSGNIAIVLPYHGSLGENSGWHSMSFERSTAFVKEYICSKESPCTALPQESFNFYLDKKLDSKSTYNHRVQLEFMNNSPSESYQWILDFRKDQRNYSLGFTDVDNAKAILMVDKTADKKSSVPEAKLDNFENTQSGYENTQFVWNINIIKYVEAYYEIPSERKEYQNSTSNDIFIQVGVGIVIAIIIAVGGLLIRKVKTGNFLKRSDSGYVSHEVITILGQLRKKYGEGFTVDDALVVEAFHKGRETVEDIAVFTNMKENKVQNIVNKLADKGVQGFEYL